MDTTVAIIIIAIIIISVILVATSASKDEGFNDQYMIPFDSPFDTRFFKVKEKKTEIGVIHNNFEARFSALIVPTANCPKTKRNSDAIMQVNGRKLDFAIVLQDVLYDAINGINIFKGLKLENIRLVATLYSGNVSIICPNDLPITDLSDIIGKIGRKVNISVGPKQSQHNISATKILRYLELEGRVNYKYYDTDEEIVANYKRGQIDLIYQVSEHPSQLIRKASNLVLSHVVSINALNNGDLYKNTLNELEFYESHESYQKALHDMEDLVPRIYPKLVVQDRNKLYVPTIKSNYVLISNDRTPDRNVAKFLNDIISYVKKPHGGKIYFLKAITPAGLSYNKIKMEYHPAAAVIYRKMNLTSDDKNSHCTFYADGHCPSTVPDIFTQTVKHSHLNESAESLANKFADAHDQAQSD